MLSRSRSLSVRYLLACPLPAFYQRHSGLGPQLELDSCVRRPTTPRLHLSLLSSWSSPSIVAFPFTALPATFVPNHPSNRPTGHLAWPYALCRFHTRISILRLSLLSSPLALRLLHISSSVPSFLRFLLSMLFVCLFSLVFLVLLALRCSALLYSFPIQPPSRPPPPSSPSRASLLALFLSLPSCLRKEHARIPAHPRLRSSLRAAWVERANENPNPKVRWDILDLGSPLGRA